MLNDDANYDIDKIVDDIRQGQAFLEVAEKVLDQINSGRSGDADFDVELVQTVQVSRAAVLRWTTVLAEQAGLVNIDVIDDKLTAKRTQIM